ncbi:MAG: LPP20 family lipoprotein [Cyclobacteriaceae bacterium]
MNKKVFFIGIFALVVFFGCKTTQTAVQNTQYAEKPSWVSERPISSLYYIGVASTNKRLVSNDFKEATKQKALNDMSSEIKVRVNSNSILNTIEENDRVKESYLSTIKVSLLAEIEGYELVDTWEDERHYWVYYKLSKAKYAEIQAQKRKVAREKALNSYLNGESFKKQGNYVSAVSSYTEGLTFLKPYLNEENKISYQGNDIELGNTILNSTQQLFNDIELKLSKSSLTLVKGLDKNPTVGIQALSASGNKLSNVPLLAIYDDSKKQQELAITGNDGKTELVINQFTAKTQSVQLMLDKKRFSPLSSTDSLVAIFLRGRQSPVQKIALKIKTPVIYATSNEKNLGVKMATPTVLNETKKMLTAKGYVFTSTKSKADLVLTIDADTRKGNQTNGFYVSYLDASISMVKLSGEEFYKNKISSQKGIQLSFEQAGFDAYNKIEKKIANLLMDL